MAQFTHKTPVVTLVERNGEARSQVMEHVTGKNIKSTLEAQVSKDAQLMTDELNVYTEAGKSFASHETVEHGKRLMYQQPIEHPEQ